jgi:hypothetical protein
VGARWNLALEAWFKESSGSRQHPGHHYGTPWAQHSYTAVHGHASLPSASSSPSREGTVEKSK